MNWRTPRLSKGQSITETIVDCTMTIDHIDRTVDPYLAGVIYDDIIIYTGLHATLADARRTCETRGQKR